MAVFSPGLIRKLMVERPGTRSESEAIKAVMRSTPECRPVELADDIPDAAIRSALAAGLFHWSRPGEERATAGEEYRIEGQLTP